jgi:hypothetical protein
LERELQAPAALPHLSRRWSGRAYASVLSCKRVPERTARRLLDEAQRENRESHGHAHVQQRQGDKAWSHMQTAQRA